MPTITRIALVAALVATPFKSSAAPLDVEGCVATALKKSALVEQAEARVAQWQARLREVEALYWPKLRGMILLSPMFTVRGDITHHETSWRALDDWGPYTRLEATLALPIYTFGRAEAGARAATERAAVERARVRAVRDSVALEVKRFYYMSLYATSLRSALGQAERTVQEAIDYAEEAFAAGTGEATQIDIAKLRYAQSEIAMATVQAASGAELAALALRHTMGLDEHAELMLADEVLPALPAAPEPTLADALGAAAKNRPEWAEIEHGKKAALALAEAEKRALAPTLILGGILSAGYAPTRDAANNPYAFDPYNRLQGGVGIGLDFNLDPASSAAKELAARATYDEVLASERFAKTGIPTKVRAAHGSLIEQRRLVAIAEDGLGATRRWLTFASTAYTTGVGEARDVLEGAVSYLQARKSYFDHVRGYFVARAELAYATGE